jgi:hypothetical protein
MRSNAPLLVGAALVVLGTVGYVAGVVTPYLGRSLTLAGLMVGIALLAVGSGRASGESDRS